MGDIMNDNFECDHFECENISECSSNHSCKSCFNYGDCFQCLNLLHFDICHQCKFFGEDYNL